MIDDFRPQRPSARPTNGPDNTNYVTSWRPEVRNQQYGQAATAHAVTTTMDNTPAPNLALLEPSYVPATPPEKRRFGLSALKKWFVGLSKKQKVIVSVVTLLFIAGIAAGVGFAMQGNQAPIQEPAPQKKSAVVAPPKPTTEAAKLTGIQVDPAVNQRQVTGVMIENSTSARPQSGLDKAGVVFEAIAEGGITRFLALYQDSETDYIGPVRSVRPYYLEWCMSFDCAIAHVGGSPDALRSIKAWGLKDLDQFAGSGHFTRIRSRAAPHNMYTSTALLGAYQDKKGYTSSNFTGMTHAKDDATATTSAVPATAISVNPSSALYASSYAYDPAAKVYRRTMAGKPHMMIDQAGAQTQVSPKNVIVMTIPYSLAPNRKHSVYQVVGSGEVNIFQNGVRITGTWTKASQTSQISFLDSTGKTIELAPGQKWITAIATSNLVSSQ